MHWQTLGCENLIIKEITMKNQQDNQHQRLQGKPSREYKQQRENKRQQG